MNDSQIIPDSSIYSDPDVSQAAYAVDTSIKIGIVRTITTDKNTKELVYLAEVICEGHRTIIPCRKMYRYSGPFNYEEYSIRSYTPSEDLDGIPAYDTKPGDSVVVAYLGGDSREGIILGALMHPSRKPSQTEKDTQPKYISEFNGIETSISDTGELTVTFKGLPTNIDELDKKPTGKKVKEPEYDKEVGTTYYKFDKEGSFEVSDNASSDPQSIKVNKPEGKITIKSGNVVIELEKSGEKTTCTCKEMTINASNKMLTKTKDWRTEASKTAVIKSPKIAIGTSGTELLDQITKLIDALGKLTIINGAGFCSPMMMAPQWSGVSQVKSKISSIKGSI